MSEINKKELLAKLKSKNGSELFFNRKYSTIFTGPFTNGGLSLVALYGNLMDGEEVERLTLPIGSSTMVVGLTNYRVISFWKFGTAQFEARYKDITQAAPGGVFTKGTITAKSGESLNPTFQDIDAKLNKYFYSYIQNKITDISNDENKTSESISVADEVKKFSELRDQEIITEKEFEAKKKELLGL